MKIWTSMSVTLVTVVALTACNTTNEEEPVNQNEEMVNENQPLDEEDHTNTIEGSNEEWTEVAIVQEEVDDTITRVDMQNDRGGNRVILYFTDEEEPRYKSILVKEESRLKIISINEDGEGEVFNEVVEDQLN
ncbi:hypothetical protein [Shouchella lehensis]|uniref:Lipoprotein n=1 Tax=Shouchella lehensis TaxID=300825 RepID=A0A4Y7WJ53_9BACI|nr:hypothetical protein [Shouchella lehensis]MBG9785906.1 hypothetical protein [Shouchella lehensis]RQW20205.1 hypothetical protein EH196_08705 [Bacillus sp. C1-1]TES48379.1 hypothetical protein E2L03_14790 [Shouchella lehensis]